MKNQVIGYLVLLFSLIPLVVSAQAIIAGQNSGVNIIYHDIDDLLIVSPYWNSSDFEYMDVNDDGSNDLMLHNDFTYYSHTNQLSVRSGINTMSQLQYSSMADEPTWIRKHIAGDIIDGSLNWSSGSGILLNQWDLKGSAGVFQGEGYLAYRICNNDTVYGWIRISNDASANGAYMSVYEFAFVTDLTDLKPTYDAFSSSFYFVSKNWLTVVIPENSGWNFLLTCFDLAGRMIFQYKPVQGSNRFNISGVQPGLYIFSLSDQKGTIITKKVIISER